MNIIFSTNFLTSVTIPVVGLFSVAAIRYKKDIQQTCATDFILLLVLFDINSLINPHWVSRLLDQVSAPYAQNALWNFLAFGFLSIIFIISFVEERVEKYYCYRNLDNDPAYFGKSSLRFPVIRFSLGWVFALSLFVQHFLFLTNNLF